MKLNKELSLVSFEQAQRLKKAGFDWPTDYGVNTHNGARIMSSLSPANYNKGYDIHIASAPTVALALKWMRNVKKMRAYVMSNSFEHWGHASTGTMGTQTDTFKNYEFAESALLDELLTLIENEK